MFLPMSSCNLCPRNCLVDRTMNTGFCHATNMVEVSSICAHRGEEPPLCGSKGICNVFFAHCNLQCVFCQNYEISRGEVNDANIFHHSLNKVADRIAEVLTETENMVGLVSASHYADQVPLLVEMLHKRGLAPTIVWNSNGYESVETLRMLAPYIDVYLPDFKYMDADLARHYSHAPDYPEKAQAALLEMLHQMGPSLATDEEGLAFRGIIVRHLVLPGQLENSKKCLQWLADNCGTRLRLSLMAQYFPPAMTHPVQWPDELGRTLTAREYDEISDYCIQLGFENVWLQQLCSTETYRPDFTRQNAF